MPRPAFAFWPLLLPLLAACSARVHTGAATTPNKAELGTAAQLGVYGGVSILGASARGTFGQDVGNAALGLEVGMPPGFRTFPSLKPKQYKRLKKSFYAFSPTVALGVHALQLDWERGDRSFGAGSPYAQVGGHLCSVSRNLDKCVGLSLEGTQLVRFGADNQTWVGASLVFGTQATPPTR